MDVDRDGGPDSVDVTPIPRRMVCRIDHSIAPNHRRMGSYFINQSVGIYSRIEVHSSVKLGDYEHTTI